MKDQDNIDDFDEFGNYIGPKKDYGLKEHSSIIGKILVIIIAYFLITRIIDPMTDNVDESEIIYEFGSYPYNKVMDLFREHPTDTDNDGLPDKEETDGWDVESHVLSMMEGDVSTFTFHLEYPGDYLVNMSVNTGEETNLSWGWGVHDRSLTIDAEEWTTITLDPNTTHLTATNHSISMKVISGNLSIDWISLTFLEYRYAEALDGVDAEPTNGTKTNMIVHVSTDPHNPDSDYDGMLDGYEVTAGVNIGGWQDPMVTNDRYAFLLAGGSTIPDNNYPSIKNDVEYAYEVLHDFYGYERDKIKVLSWDGKVQNKDIIDAPGTLENIGNAFDELEQEMGPNDFLFVYIVSHGLPGVVEVYNTPSEHDVFKYTWLMENLTAIRDSGGAKRIAVVVEACNSGSCLVDVHGDGIIVIGSTEPLDDSYTFASGYALFTYYFFQALERPNLAFLPSYENVKNVELTFEEHKFISLGEAFRIAKDNLRIQGITKADQIPQIDQDGDGTADEKEEGLAYLTYI